MKYQIQDGQCDDLVAYVINLKRRPERLESFWKKWNESGASQVLPNPLVWYGVDGVSRASEMPESFLPAETCNRPAGWGCVASHAEILSCLANVSDPDDPMSRDVLIFEDDANFVEDFAEKTEAYFHSLPKDFDFAYLGGFHYQPPTQIGISLARPGVIHGTHGYLVSRKFQRTLARELSKRDNHPDLIIRKLLRQSKANAFCTIPALVGQGGFVSDIVGRLQPKEF